MSATLELLSPAEASSRLASILDCPNDVEAIRITAMAEYIRAFVNQPYFWAADWGPPRAVHTHRIISAVRRDLGFLWKDTDQSASNSELSENKVGALGAMDVIRRLGEVGDLVDLGGGFWVPGPVRMVQATDGGEGAFLVVAGAPFEALKTMLAAHVSCIGCGRFIRPDRARSRRLRFEHELQSVDDWLGGSSENIAAWTRRIFKVLIERMSPAPDVEASECEIYVPDDFPGKPGSGNWFPARELRVVPTDLRLCRAPAAKSAIYDRPTYLAVLWEDEGRAVFRQLALVPEDIRLRLLFGFEQMRGVQRTVVLELKNRICRVKIPFKLPEPEIRILALGWPVGKDSKGRANFYAFAADIAPFLVQMLSRLGVRVSKKTLQEKER